MAFATSTRATPAAARNAPLPATPAASRLQPSPPLRALRDVGPALHLAPALPLEPVVRTRLEKTFGRNLLHIRVQQNAAVAAGLGVPAFAFGSTVVLGAGARPDDLGLMAVSYTHLTL